MKLSIRTTKGQVRLEIQQGPSESPVILVLTQEKLKALLPILEVASRSQNFQMEYEVQ